MEGIEKIQAIEPMVAHDGKTWVDSTLNNNKLKVYDGTDWVQFGSVAGTEELGFLRDFVGKTGPGSESPTYTSTDVIAQSDNLEVAIGKLDGSIGTQAYTNDNVVTDGESTTASIDAIDTAIGDLQNSTLEIAGTNVVAVAGITLDTLPLTDATQVEWMVQVRENTTPANRRGVIIHAFNDGSTLVTVYDYYGSKDRILVKAKPNKGQAEFLKKIRQFGKVHLKPPATATTLRVSSAPPHFNQLYSWNAS